jgi:hypothetical protein
LSVAITSKVNRTPSNRSLRSLSLAELPWLVAAVPLGAENVAAAALSATGG